MSKKMVIVFLAVVCLSVAKEGVCEQKPKIKMNADNVTKAMKVIRSNQAIFQDPEKLAQFVRVSKTLKKNK